MIDLGKAVYSLIVDESGLDAGLKSADTKVTSATQQISAKMVAFSAAIGGAIGSAFGGYVQKLLGELNQVQEWFTSAPQKTAEYGLEMEHLGARMGMTAGQAAVLNGVLQRYGIESGIATRAVGLMSNSIRQTQQSLDPFSTKLGQLLGTLRDTSGHMLDTSQVLDLARQKIAAATTETEKLQLAQQIFGTRMGGALIPALKATNEEWEKQKKSVADSLGPVDAAADAALKYKAATAELEQNLHGLQIQLGVAMLPTLAQWIKDMSGGLAVLKEWVNTSSTLSATVSGLKGVLTLKSLTESAEGGTHDLLAVFEKLHIVSAGTADNFAHMRDYQKQAADSAAESTKKKDIEAEAQAAITAEVTETEKIEGQLVSIAGKKVEFAEKLASLGQGTQAEIELSVQTKLLELTKQRASLELDLAKASTQDQQLDIQEKLLQNQLASISVLSEQAQKRYADEELAIKANGALNSTTEIAFLQRQLQDVNIVGDARLKLEGELYQKKVAYEEQMMTLSRQLGISSVQDELKFRQQKTIELMGKGDISGAGAEMKKVRDLQIQEADSAMEFEKKLTIVSIGDQIDYQKKKLEIVKGNADEERKVLESIADLDKQLYDKRLSYAISYGSNIQSEYQSLQKAAASGGEVMSAAMREKEANMQLRDTTKMAGDVLHGGGNEQQWQASLKFADSTMKQAEELKEAGKTMSAEMKDAVSVSKDILHAAGVSEVKSPGGPSPTVASLLSPAEGLATSGLARGSEIPRLDTSFSDLAIRVRDVFLGTIPNIQSFSDAISKAVTKISGTLAPSPAVNAPGGGLGPGGGQQFQTPLATGSSSPAQPGFGADEVSSGGFPLRRPQEDSGVTQVVAALKESVKAHNNAADILKNAIDTLNKVNALDRKVKVDIGVDPNSKDGIVAVATQGIADAIS